MDKKAIADALREIDHGYFGHYEFSEAEREAVETLIELANEVLKEMKIEKIETCCDLCGTNCSPINQIHIPMGGNHEFRNEIVLRVNALIYYGTDHGDVCEQCLRTALKSYLVMPERNPAHADKA